MLVSQDRASFFNFITILIGRNDGVRLDLIELQDVLTKSGLFCGLDSLNWSQSQEDLYVKLSLSSGIK